MPVKTFQLYRVWLIIVPVKTFQVRSDNPSNNYLHQLMLMLHLFEWLCNMLLFLACQRENCFE